MAPAPTVMVTYQDHTRVPIAGFHVGYGLSSAKRPGTFVCSSETQYSVTEARAAVAT